MKESYCGLCQTCPLDNPDFLEAVARVKAFLAQSPFYWWLHCYLESANFSLPEFLRGLDWFLDHHECPGCKEGGGMLKCPVRACARQRQYAHCSECPDFQTCEHFKIILEIMRLKY